MHDHGAGGTAAPILAIPFAVALVVYFGAVIAERRRGRAWSPLRSASWATGILIALSAVIGPLADAAHHDFEAHMAAHLAIGMLAPLLLVLAAPMTLALRTLDVVPARRLSKLLRSAPLAIVGHPVSAALLSVGSLWLVYATPLAERMLADPLLHALLLAHFLAAGFVFTASILAVDPSPHRASFPVRAVVLVLAVAGHSILAKAIYADPPAGVPTAEAAAGAVLMYRGGDLIELALIVAFCARWYRAARPRRMTHVPPAASA